jgi:hypothetical protein
MIRTRWTVITEIPLISEIRSRGRDAERRLFAVQELAREEGPDAFGLHAPYLAGVPSWDQLSAPCTPDLFIEVGGRMLWVELEILPGRTIIFRRGRLE